MSHHWKIVSSETIDLTQDLAADFNAMTASATERDLSQKRIKHLEKAILAGRAIPFDWAKATIADTGTVVRINGQHSSKMLTSLNGSFPEGLKVHLTHYEVDNKESAALLFRQIDSRQSARSIADIAGVYQGLAPVLDALPNKVARDALEGVVWHERKVTRAFISRRETIASICSPVLTCIRSS